jgi:2-keto-3-deoxy-6-phosphogluconate aldolase
VLCPLLLCKTQKIPFEYLQFPKVLACGGSWIAKSALITAGKFDEIKNNTREAVGIVKKLKNKIK